MKSTKGATPVAMIAVVVVLAIAFGALTGFLSARVIQFPASSGTAESEEGTTTGGGSDAPKTAGVKDTDTFKDEAEGTLRKGGFEGEGTHHLERPGGESQNVYLVSSTVDLRQFVDKEVMVLGKTYSTEKAGWFMDVGYIEVIE
jgi:hypothetical protein